MIESNKISSQLADDVLKRGPKGYDELTKEWETSQKEKRMNNYYNRVLARKYIKEVIEDGLQKAKDRNLSSEVCNAWIEYSRRMVELTTKDYNPSILLNYLRVINNTFTSSHSPLDKLNMCLEYLIGIFNLL